jgi:ribonuclease HI
MPKIEIYTDGSALGNPGNGGYGIVLKFGNKLKKLNQGFVETTNNRMELLAVIVAIENLKSKNYDIHIYSDSKYVVDAINKGWLNGWVLKNFKGKANVDLWKRFLNSSKGFQLTFHWVKGHAGHVYNEMCDQLAVAAAESKNLIIDEGYKPNA